ncbi:uncharacterized protein CXorf58 homolog [Sorex araneus]|uniref:uncharacterized protein CXorf58 homolog n=1 Tax=Sorex araneus TaxID=42254 RepID=UPI00064A9101|nr:uncharacterized protein CXorf58 homolog [Sorex araneus]
MNNHFMRSLSSLPNSSNVVWRKKPSTEWPRGIPSKLSATHNEKARIIQRAWLAYADRGIFQLLKHTVCAVEHYVAHEILKKVSPAEGELVKDPSMKCKVRFRFGGETFPPYIVFKIFLHTDGHGYKYFCGRNILKSSTEAVADSYRLMGRNKFYNQMMEDERFHQKFKVSDEIDVITMKDYMQYSSLLDNIPASCGGRNNHWRRLNLKNIPKTMMIYDIIDFVQSGTVSKRFQKEMKFLKQKPQSEEMHQQQLQIITDVRICQPTIHVQLPARQEAKEVKYLGRRSKQAQTKVEKMRKAYKTPTKKTMKMEPEEKVILSTPSFTLVKLKETSSGISDDEDFEKEEQELFRWWQDLVITNILDTS